MGVPQFLYIPLAIRLFPSPLPSRVNSYTDFGNGRGVGPAESQAAIPPLPEGEGRGEGEGTRKFLRRAQFPDALIRVYPWLEVIVYLFAQHNTRSRLSRLDSALVCA